ncbi:hypothetical protein B9Z19DRAFT_1060199 [Tuber borchii]|uniref:Uncharacterized protein n=1 Tax=Tuber borchii TaxID=42251 RepID=A0A2T7A9B3_TUBBO|nr:hypothetical protein B9Z19DRAFT_1060199 [Tuber borchii]
MLGLPDLQAPVRSLAGVALVEGSDMGESLTSYLGTLTNHQTTTHHSITTGVNKSCANPPSHCGYGIEKELITSSDSDSRGASRIHTVSPHIATPESLTPRSAHFTLFAEPATLHTVPQGNTNKQRKPKPPSMQKHEKGKPPPRTFSCTLMVNSEPRRTREAEISFYTSPAQLQWFRAVPRLPDPSLTLLL